MDRLEEQYSDAINSIGVTDPMQLIDMDKNPAIFLGQVGSETICLAKLISDISQDIQVILRGRNGGFIQLQNDVITPIAIEGSFSYFLHEFDFHHNPSRFTTHGNAAGFKYYSEQKRLSGIILEKNGILTPREIQTRGCYIKSQMDPINNIPDFTEKIDRCEAFFIELSKKYNERIREFWKTIGKDKTIVIKPVNGKCGRDVLMYNFSDFEEEFGDTQVPNIFLSNTTDVLIQEKVNSFPIHIDEVKKDWNVRVLVTYDIQSKSYITAGIVGRIDNDGGPVNRSISADYISLGEISKLTGWSEEQYQKIKKDIELTAQKAVLSISQKGIQRFPRYKRTPQGMEHLSEVENFQDLSGVDIILNEDMEACVIEVNDSNSGCMYELMKLEGLASLTPIAQSIINKTKIAVDFNAVTSMISDSIGKDNYRRVLNGELELTVSEEGEGIEFILEEK